MPPEAPTMTSCAFVFEFCCMTVRGRGRVPDLGGCKEDRAAAIRSGPV
jgi:hypothetical protein